LGESASNHGTIELAVTIRMLVIIGVGIAIGIAPGAAGCRTT
jgi:hypothetical protein